MGELEAAVFIVEHKGRPLKFGSYRMAHYVDSPMKATIYATLNGAEKRASGEIWIDGIPALGEELEVTQLVVEVISMSRVFPASS